MRTPIVVGRGEAANGVIFQVADRSICDFSRIRFRGAMGSLAVTGTVPRNLNGSGPAKLFCSPFSSRRSSRAA